MTSIETKVYQLIAEKLGVDQAKINPEISFDTDLNIDSLDFFELIANVEKAFDITISDEQFGKLKTVGSLTTYVSQLVNIDKGVTKQTSLHHVEPAEMEA